MCTKPRNDVVERPVPFRSDFDPIVKPVLVHSFVDREGLIGREPKARECKAGTLLPLFWATSLISLELLNSCYPIHYIHICPNLTYYFSLMAANYE